MGLKGTEVRDAQEEVQKHGVERARQEIGRRKSGTKVFCFLLFSKVVRSGKCSTLEETQRK